MLRSLVLLLALNNLNAKEIRIPDTCQGPVCLSSLLWKKGFAVHTFSGTITTKKAIQAVTLTLAFGDDRRSGSTNLVLRDVAVTQGFFFKVDNTYNGIKWERSHLRLEMSAIHSMGSTDREGITCRFNVVGSRLRLEVQNRSSSDLILDYSLLTLTAANENHKLNGIGGRYIEFSRPKPSALIPSGTTYHDELVPVEAVKLIDAEWTVEPLLNRLLVAPDVTIFIPLSRGTETKVERIRLEVEKTLIHVSAKVEEG